MFLGNICLRGVGGFGFGVGFMNLLMFLGMDIGDVERFFLVIVIFCEWAVNFRAKFIIINLPQMAVLAANRHFGRRSRHLHSAGAGFLKRRSRHFFGGAGILQSPFKAFRFFRHSPVKNRRFS